MANRSLEKEEEYVEQEQEDTQHYDDHDNEDEEEEEEEEEEEQELEYRRKKVMIRVVSSGQRLSALAPFVNCSSISSIGSLRCQADECGVELRMAKAYHKRHKVCERHAKAAVVLVSGLRQRFCQQCSKFHEISQFDNNKKSCREKLAGHNERRRKTHTELQAEDDEQKLTESRMNGSLLKAMRYSDYGNMSFQGSSNMKHSCSK